MDWDEQTKKEWDELGFYYEYDDHFKQWRIFGSKAGLQKISEIIESYASNQNNEGISEHIHLGPYNYLKIMTWHEAVVDRKYIAGSLKDLLMLGRLINDKLAVANIREMSIISDEYSSKSTAILLFIIMADNFRPSSIEFSK